MTSDLILAAGDAIDLQMHTTFSDGAWAPEHLIGHLVRVRDEHEAAGVQ